MDAMLSRSGIKDAKTDLGKAEVYLLAEPGTQLAHEEIKREIEGDYGYGLRSFQRSTELKWEELGRADR